MDLIQTLHIDFEPINFGKYKDYTPEQVYKRDAGYIVFCYEKIEPKICSPELYEKALKRDKANRIFSGRYKSNFLKG